MKIQELLEAEKKQKQWYEEQLDRQRELTKHTETTLNNEMARQEELHAQEAKLWQDVKTQYEPTADDHLVKIGHVKTTLDELKAKTEMGTKRIRTLLHSHRDKFVWQLKEAMDRGYGPNGHNRPQSCILSGLIKKTGRRKVMASTNSTKKVSQRSERTL